MGLRANTSPRNRAAASYQDWEIPPLSQRGCSRIVGRVQDIILAAEESWRAGNGEAMRRRFQAGTVRKRGTRSPVWEGRYYEPVLVAGKLKKVRRAVVLGLC